jgi:hypothetical protein
MGLFSKIGKALKKAVKDVGKVATKAIDLNPFIPGTSAQQALSSGASQLAGVLPIFGGIAGGSSSGGGLLGGLGGLFDSGASSLKCSLLGDCGPSAPTSPAVPAGGYSTSTAPSASGDGALPTWTKQALLFGAAAFAAWWFLKRRRG